MYMTSRLLSGSRASRTELTSKQDPKSPDDPQPVRIRQSTVTIQTKQEKELQQKDHIKINSSNRGNFVTNTERGLLGNQIYK